MRKLIISESERNEIYQMYNVSSNLIVEATTIPRTESEIRQFQNWVLNTIKDKKVLGPRGADGDWGPKTQLAWTMYGAKYPLKNSVGSSRQYGSSSNSSTRQGYPYDKLNNNPTPKFIAWVIKQSNGGVLGNDSEAHAEAAFNAIKSPQVYRQVTKFLATDPYEFISSFMDTKTRYHHNPVFNHYQELFKSSPDNLPKVKRPNNVKDFQNWVISVKKDRKILGKYGADGDWGDSTKNAWAKYGNEYLKTDRNNNLEDSEKYNGFAIAFAFPEYEPHVDGTSTWDKFLGVVSNLINDGEKENTYGKIGHAGISLVTQNGNVITYEFGRYLNTKQSLGVKLSKNLGKIAKIENNEITNLDSVISTIHRNTRGDGPREKIRTVVLRTPNVEGGIKYANSVMAKDYEAFDFEISDNDANCATFSLEVVRACGISVPTGCFPTPVKMIEELEYVRDIQNKDYLSLIGKAGRTGLYVNPTTRVPVMTFDKLNEK